MTASNIQEKIKKLLALGRGKANESESMQALNLAMRLMAEHGISEDQLATPERRETVISGKIFEIRGVWQIRCAQAAAQLFPTGVLISGDSGVYFVGRPSNIQAAQEVMAHLIYQIEYFYKACMPKGMSQRERATFRKEFKLVAALRILERCHEIAHQKPSTTGTELVIFGHLDKLRTEVEEYFSALNVKTKKSRSIDLKDHRALILGRSAGDQTELRKAID